MPYEVDGDGSEQRRARAEVPHRGPQELRKAIFAFLEALGAVHSEGKWLLDDRVIEAAEPETLRRWLRIAGEACCG